MNELDPEIRTRVLEWQKKHQIRDDDPAMAFLELLSIYGRLQSNAPAGSPASLDLSKLELPNFEELKLLLSNSEKMSGTVLSFFLKKKVSGVSYLFVFFFQMLSILFLSYESLSMVPSMKLVCSIKQLRSPTRTIDILRV